jgi:hypothetical protein
MAQTDFLGIDEQDPTTVVDYLGNKAPLAFKNQPALPVTGGPAVGAPSGGGPVQAGSQPAPVTAGPAGPTLGSLDPSILNVALGSGIKLADLASKLFGSAGVPAGAIETPSGQLTTSAPEILRPQQFPDVPDVPGGTFASEGTATAAPLSGTGGGFTAGELGNDIGAAFGGANAIFNLVQAIRSGNPQSIASASEGLGSAGIVGAAEAGLIPAEIAGQSVTAAAGPISSAAGVVTAILIDALTSNVPGDQARDFNLMMSAAVPEDLAALDLGALVLPFVNNSLSTDQAKTLFTVARTGLKAEEMLAEPLGAQGRRQGGVTFSDYPGANENVLQATPSALLATLKLQDLLASRGITPDQMPVPQTSFWGAPTINPDPGNVNMNAEAAELANWTAGNSSMFLTPSDFLGKIGHYGGFEGVNLEEVTSGPQAAQVYGAAGAPADQAYAWGPQVDAMLAKIQPGQYEEGLRSFLSRQTGYADSPLAALWAQPAPAPTDQPSSDTGAVTPADIENAFASEFSPGGGGSPELVS